MPSKTSKQARAKSSSPAWKDVPGCSESELERAAAELGAALRAGEHVLLEGPMGVGKTTFARALLHSLGVSQPPEGSPSFAIAHEYESPRGPVAHLDFYRLRSEEEIDEAGIPAYFWEREGMIVIAEWTSMWPEFERSVLRTGRAWKATLAFGEKDPLKRNLRIEKP